MEVSLETVTRPECVTLTVRNGGTIPAQLLAHLFDPFRGSQREPGRSDGLGLGLYIVSQIMQAHGGTVEVETGKNQSTAFTVRLPRGSGRRRAFCAALCAAKTL